MTTTSWLEILLHTCTGAGNIKNYLHKTNFTCTTLNFGSINHINVLHHMTFMHKTQYMDQCRLGAGRNTCTA